MIKDNFKLKGHYKIIVKDYGKVIKEIDIDNTIMKLQCYELADVLLGSAGDLEFRYCAVGTGTTAVTVNDTVLDTEIFRTYRGALTRDNYRVFAEFNILKGEANTTLNEIGIFCSSTATSSADTGKLWSRVILSGGLVKTSSMEILIQYTVEFIPA